MREAQARPTFLEEHIRRHLSVPGLRKSPRGHTIVPRMPLRIWCGRCRRQPLRRYTHQQHSTRLTCRLEGSASLEKRSGQSFTSILSANLKSKETGLKPTHGLDIATTKTAEACLQASIQRRVPKLLLFVWQNLLGRAPLYLKINKRELTQVLYTATSSIFFFSLRACL